MVSNQCPLCDCYYTMKGYKSVEDLDKPKSLGICPKCRKKDKEVEKQFNKLSNTKEFKENGKE